MCAVSHGEDTAGADIARPSAYLRGGASCGAGWALDAKDVENSAKVPGPHSQHGAFYLGESAKMSLPDQNDSR